MAWKLKRSKTGEDEPKTKGLKPGDEGAASDFEHKPGAFEPVPQNYDSSEYGAQDRTVMLLNDEDFLPGLISGGTNGTSNGVGHEEEKPVDPEEDFINSALNSADAAVSFLNAAKGEGEEGSNTQEQEATGEFDLDAFAPYQPSTNGNHVDLDVTDAIPTAVEAPRPVSETLSAPVTAARLVVRLGQFSASYEVVKPEVTIGRPDPRIDVFPDVAIEWDDAVSRNHARILHKSDGDYVEDTGSTNGSKLNDKPLSAHKPLLLKDGDRIQLGEKTEITYMR